MTDLAPNRELLLQIAQQLPATAQILQQLGALLTDANSGLEEIAQLLRRDTALAGRIIRISNSAAFGMSGRVGSIEEAVKRVGFSEIYRLTGLASAAQLAEHHLAFYGIKGPQVRDNSLFTALCAEALATRARTDARVAYTAGLLRSTGKLVLDRFANRPPKSATPFVQSGSSSLLAWELSSFGCNNAEVAEMVLSAWRFPVTISEAVGHQFEDTVDPKDNAVHSTLLYIAGGIAYNSGFGLTGEHGSWNVNPSTLQSVRLTPSLVLEAQEEARSGFEAIRSSL